MQNISNTNNSFDVILKRISDGFNYPILIVGILQSVLLIIWIVYVLRSINSSRTRKRIFLNSYVEVVDEVYRIFRLNEVIVRNVLFLLFLIFEFFFFTLYTSNRILFNSLQKSEPSPLILDPNCSLQPDTVLARVYDQSVNVIVYYSLDSLSIFAFILMLWFYVVLNLHLNFAAKEVIRPKLMIYLVLLGVCIALVALIFVSLKWTYLFGIFVQSILNQIILLAAFIISQRFLYNMHSKLKSASHIVNSNTIKQHQNLQWQYRFIIIFLSITFECYVIKDLILFNSYAILESISLNPCWFRSTYGIDVPTFSPEVSSRMRLISQYCFAIIRIFNMIFFFNLFLLNVYVIGKYVYTRLKRLHYRYRPEDFDQSSPYIPH